MSDSMRMLIAVNVLAAIDRDIEKLTADLQPWDVFPETAKRLMEMRAEIALTITSEKDNLSNSLVSAEPPSVDNIASHLGRLQARLLYQVLDEANGKFVHFDDLGDCGAFKTFEPKESTIERAIDRLRNDLADIDLSVSVEIKQFQARLVRTKN